MKRIKKIISGAMAVLLCTILLGPLKVFAKTNYYFDNDYYLSSCLALDASRGGNLTLEELKESLKQQNMSPQLHYELLGRFYGLNPNAYFNEYEYLLAKANQLNSWGEPLPDGQSGEWTADMLKQQFDDADELPIEHYTEYGAYEKDAQGNYINPSNAFDANAYYSAFLAQLQKFDPDLNWTLEILVMSFEHSVMSPVDHYHHLERGGVENGRMPLVQTVPASQRVQNDPAREMIGTVVPTNYSSATPAPTGEERRTAIQKPCDIGWLSPAQISPEPVFSKVAALVPGDPGYALPPSNITDTARNPVFQFPGGWLILCDDRETLIGVDNDGAILGKTSVVLADATPPAVGKVITISDSYRFLRVELKGVPKNVTVVAALSNNVYPPDDTNTPDQSGSDSDRSGSSNDADTGRGHTTEKDGGTSGSGVTGGNLAINGINTSQIVEVTAKSNSPSDWGSDANTKIVHEAILTGNPAPESRVLSAVKIEGNAPIDGVKYDGENIIIDGGLEAGNYQIIIEATQGSVTITYTLHLLVYDPLILVYDSPALPEGKQKEPYEHEFKAEGGIPPYTFTLASGDLPGGLELALDGILSGKLSEHSLGFFSFSIKVEDSEGNESEPVSCSLWINGPPPEHG